MPLSLALCHTLYFSARKSSAAIEQTYHAQSARRTAGMKVRCACWVAGAAFMVASISASAVPAAETTVRLSLDHAIDGTAAPFLLPLDRGWYKTEGLDVGIVPGNTAVEPITRVASGEFEFGLADINALIRYRDVHPKAPVKAVYMVYNKPAYAVIGRKSRGIATPRDLEGKRVGIPAADPAGAAWPIFSKANDIGARKVIVENIGAPVREPMLAAGQIDAVTGRTYALFIDLKDKGVPVNDIVVLPMADYGVVLYGKAIIVNTAFADTHPELVKGFLRAFLKGLRETAARPASAIGAVLSHGDRLREDIELERLDLVIRENILTPEAKANGYGGIEPKRFADAIEQLTLAYRFNGAKPKLSDIFDASYLPSSADHG
jgi:NitT/TauT family transport system substrate-binding protein